MYSRKLLFGLLPRYPLHCDLELSHGRKCVNICRGDNTFRPREVTHNFLERGIEPKTMLKINKLEPCVLHKSHLFSYVYMYMNLMCINHFFVSRASQPKTLHFHPENLLGFILIYAGNIFLSRYNYVANQLSYLGMSPFFLSSLHNLLCSMHWLNRAFHCLQAGICGAYPGRLSNISMTRGFVRLESLAAAPAFHCS